MKSLNWMGIMNLFNCQYQKKKNLYSFRLYFFQVSFRGIIFKLMLTKHYISFLNPLNHMVLKWYTFVSASEELPEAVIIRDLVYAFQGIEGRWIRYDPTKEGYRINHQVTLMQYKILYHQNKLWTFAWIYHYGSWWLKVQ